MCHPNVMRQILKSGADEVFGIKNLPINLKRIKKEDERKLETFMDMDDSFLERLSKKHLN
jgi:hypothetical protein